MTEVPDWEAPKSPSVDVMEDEQPPEESPLPNIRFVMKENNVYRYSMVAGRYHLAGFDGYQTEQLSSTSVSYEVVIKQMIFSNSCLNDAPNAHPRALTQIRPT